MFKTRKAKLISNLLRQEYREVRYPLQQAFRESVLNATTEVDFFRRLIRALEARLSDVSLPGIVVSCRTAEIHQKPIVRSELGRCELGDLLVVVKYKWVSQPIEAKSIIYQVKLSADSESTNYHINQTQLELLSRWPTFEFGRTQAGYSTYSIRPRTLEFGSYMLEPRSPPRTYRPKYGCFGACPHAEAVMSIRSSTIDVRNFKYVRGDVSSFFSHIAFEIGEHHSNRQVSNLIDALYRFADMTPDPPKEFIEFSSEASDTATFGIMEITVTANADSIVVKQFQEEKRLRQKHDKHWKNKNAT